MCVQGLELHFSFWSQAPHLIFSTEQFPCFCFQLTNFLMLNLYSNCPLTQIIIWLVVIHFQLYSNLFGLVILKLLLKYFQKYFQSHCLRCSRCESQMDSHSKNFDNQLDLFFFYHFFDYCLIKLIYRVILIEKLDYYYLIIIYLVFFTIRNFLIYFQSD